jgi:hypothetical protein
MSSEPVPDLEPDASPPTIGSSMRALWRRARWLHTEAARRTGSSDVGLRSR